MASLWRFGGLSWWRLAARVYRQAGRDELLGRAAELAYFFLFSVFPLLLFLTTLLGYLAQENWGLRREMFQWVGTVSPSADVTALLRDTLREITDFRGSAKLSFGLIAALLLASNGMDAVARALNVACGLTESRPWWLRRVLAIALVVVFAAFSIGALAVVFFGRWISDHLADLLGFSAEVGAVWHVAQWCLGVAFVVLAFDLVYNFAPNLARRHRVWFTPGACVGVALWLAASYGLRLYLAEFGVTSRTYGSLGAVIVLLMWFYFTAMAILVGGEVNSEISLAALGHRDRADRSRR